MEINRAPLPRSARWLFKWLLTRDLAPYELCDAWAAWQFRQYWLVAYVAMWGAMIVPGLLRGQDWSYQAVAVLAPHFLFYLVFASFAHAWIGYRWAEVNPGPSKRAAKRIGIAAALIGVLAGAFPGWKETAIVPWARDTFANDVVLALLIAAVPVWLTIIEKLRAREYRQFQHTLAAQAEAERLGRCGAEAEIRLLQAQLEPHFLYNTLANLRYLVQKDASAALRMTDALIDYLRTAVTDIRADRVSLGQEADHVRHYLDIMQIRMQGRLEYVIDLPVDLRAVEVPPLVLLTLVENAVKHGLSRVVDGGRIEVSAVADGAMLRLAVTDTGAGLSSTPAPAAGSTRAGLANVRERLALTYGDRAHLTLGPNAPRGAIAVIELPRVRDVACITPAAAARGVEPAPTASACGPFVRTWVGQVQGHHLSIVTSYLGGTDLVIDGRLRAVNRYIVPEVGEPMVTAEIIAEPDTRVRLEVYWTPTLFGCPLRAYADGQRVPLARGRWTPFKSDQASTDHP